MEQRILLKNVESTEDILVIVEMAAVVPGEDILK